MKESADTRIGTAAHFEIIKKKYDDFHRALLGQGRLPAKDTGIGYWGVTPVAEAYELFKRIGLHRHSSLLDLGCGDGRIVLLASLFDIEAHGIEYDEELINHALDHRRNLALEPFKKTKLLQKDFLSHDLSAYDVLFMSPDKPFFRTRIEEKIKREFNGKVIVHGWEFHPGSLRHEEEHVINGEKFVVYKV